MNHRYWRFLFTLVLVLGGLIQTSAVAKTYKGLFGNYRREKFTENEANSSDFGLDFNLSTMFPFTPLASSSETTGVVGAALPATMFFNAEMGAFFTVSYHWEVFLNFGYCNYDTRQLSATPSSVDPTLPVYHKYEMVAVPMLVGFKYRFSTSDIVPYIGAGGGLVSTKQRVTYDNGPTIFDERVRMVPAVQALGGFEFFFAPNSGIRLEVGVSGWLSNQEIFESGGSPTQLPTITYGANPITLRYASGLFFLL